MTKSIIKILVAITILAVTFYNCSNDPKKPIVGVSLPEQTLPQDVTVSCTVDDATFASWFEGGKVTENGFVNPANSVAFKSEGNCSFYRWSEQMFLWLTSNGGKYKGGSTVMESPVFYVVSTEDDKGTRDLIPYKKGDALDAAIDIAKIGTEEGQATNNVLLDRNGNVVYYITMVNDVYAALLNMAAEDGSKVTKFPTTQEELNNILAVAKAKNIPVLEPNALAIELKTSWVKLEGDMKKEDFVTIESDIPVYDKKSDALWTLTGKTTRATLALVGMHIVGSVAGHPEMVWSTFEHKYNAPNAKYQYVNKAGKVVDVNPDDSGYWLFNSNPQDVSIGNVNKKGAIFMANAINGINGAPIKPINTIRVLPWGSAYDMQPNQLDKTTADANSQVISMNNAIMSKLAGNDVRKNYIFIGSTWTFHGAAPNGKVYPKDTVLTNGAAIGTSALANSTMETDFQLATPEIAEMTSVRNCFMCHSHTDKVSGASSLDPKIHGLSHIFMPLMDGLKIERPQLKEVKKK